MALSAPRNIFGVHSVTPYSRTDGTFYGIMKVLAGSSITINGDLVKLQGGSSRWPWAIEDGQLSAEMTVKTREFPDFLFTLFLGQAPTANSAETSGSVTTLTNIYGTLVVSTGLASVAVLSASKLNLKFGKYIVVAATSTTVHVYHSSDIDFRRGSDTVYINDALRVASSQSIVSGTGTDIANIGITITGGAGSIGMTVGDTAYFYCRPVNTKSMDVTIGNTGNVNPEFGCLVYAGKRGNAEMMEIDLIRCKGTGLPIQFEEFKWSETEIKVQAFYDPSSDSVMAIRHITPTTLV